MMNLGIVESIVYLSGNLFRIYIISCFLRAFFETTASSERKLIRILCYFLYYGVNSAGFLYFNWAPTIIIITNVVGSSLLAMTYIGTWKYKVCSVVATVATNIVCEDLIYNLLVTMQVAHIVIIGVLCANLLFFMIALLLQKIIDLKKGEDIAVLELFAVVLIPICSILISALSLDTCSDNVAVAIGGISMVAINILIFILLNSIQNMYHKLMNASLLKQQINAYEKQMALSKSSEKKLTSLRHDIKNHFLVLEQFAKQNDCLGILEYLNGLTPTVENPKQFVSTGNAIIDSFLNMKLSIMADFGVSISIEAKVSNELFIKTNDFSTILGNLLDNAQTALEHCKKKRN